VVTCTGGVLDGSLGLDPAPDDATITLTVRAPRRHSFAYDLRSVIDPDDAVAESDEADNTGSKSVTVTSKVNLTFADTLKSTGSKGNTGAVEWTLKNTGTAGATDVWLVVNMAVGSIPQQMSKLPDGWSCQVEADPINRVTCHGDIGAGGSLDFKVDTFVTADNPHSNGEVDPDDLIVETNETDNADQG
jgi:subtilase family serine protease